MITNRQTTGIDYVEAEIKTMKISNKTRMDYFEKVRLF